jgi:uncharacterized protein YdbL (DUF1318 family)
MRTREELLAAVVVALMAAGCKIIVAPVVQFPAEAMRNATIIERSSSGEAPEVRAAQFGSSVLEQAVVGRRTRAAEMQGLKNNRIVGETHAGYLAVVELPPGEYGKYAQGIVDAENLDRRTIYVDQAAQLNIPVEQIETSTGKVIYDRSFKGEFVEELRGNKWTWVAKETDRTEAAEKN